MPSQPTLNLDHVFKLGDLRLPMSFLLDPSSVNPEARKLGWIFARDSSSGSEFRIFPELRFPNLSNSEWLNLTKDLIAPCSELRLEYKLYSVDGWDFILCKPKQLPPLKNDSYEEKERRREKAEKEARAIRGQRKRIAELERKKSGVVSVRATFVSGGKVSGK